MELRPSLFFCTGLNEETKWIHKWNNKKTKEIQLGIAKHGGVQNFASRTQSLSGIQNWISFSTYFLVMGKKFIF